MSVGNIAKTLVQNQIKRKMGQYSPYVLNTIGGPLDQLQNKVDATVNGVLSKIPGAGSQLGKVVFDAVLRGYGTGKNNSILPPPCGTPEVDGIEASSSEYQIVIKSKVGEVRAVLQEKTAFRVTGDWEPFLPLGSVGTAARAVSQALTGRDLLSSFMTRRIWKGTSPIEMTVNLLFPSITDTYNNVVEPYLRLMQMALPSDAGKLGPLPLLAPPGPSAFWDKDIDESTKQSTDGGDGGAVASVKSFVDHMRIGSDTISIQFGRFLFFKSVIIKEVSPSFSPKMSVDGWPIECEVSVTFQTYEIMTKETMKEAVLYQRGT